MHSSVLEYIGRSRTSGYGVPIGWNYDLSILRAKFTITDNEVFLWSSEMYKEVKSKNGQRKRWKNFKR